PEIRKGTAEPPFIRAMDRTSFHENRAGFAMTIKPEVLDAKCVLPNKKPAGKAPAGYRQDGTRLSLFRLALLYFVTWPRISPPLLAAVWTFTYHLPAMSSLACASVS